MDLNADLHVHSPYSLATSPEMVPSVTAPFAKLKGIGEGTIEWLGKVEDIREAFALADCVVLPSRYREGVPRSLLEAASMAKPLVASDSVGAREPVEEGEIE